MRAIAACPRRRGRWAALALILALMALAPTIAQGGTGGAATAAANGAAEGGLAFTPMRSAGATWYGPGLYGHRTACGLVLRPQTVGVANRDLPCGATVKLAYRGRQIVTTVIDRGPYSQGNDWDLTNGARLALRFAGSDRIRYAVALSYARSGG
jgi:rare lipoprotein A (peptidoglycan hydrolase)